MIENLMNQLAEECKKRGLNYIFVVEDNGLHDNYSVNGETPIRKLVDTLKEA